MNPNRRRVLAALLAGAAVPGVAAACGRLGRGGDAGVPGPRIGYRPAPGSEAATGMLPTAEVGVTVTDGWLQRARLTNPDGRVVAGAYDRDRVGYVITEPLGYGTAYTWSGSVVGRDGRAVPLAGKLTTVTPTRVIGGGFQLFDGQTVGVAAPVILQFDAPISDKATVERALRIVSDPPVEGGWAWLPDEVQGARVHWRPRNYWPPGTEVSVTAAFYGLGFGDGAYGARDMSLSFQIGREQVVRAEVFSHRMQVIRDGAVIMDVPCSYGEGDQARNVTRNGIHVVTEKYADFSMSNPAAGYNDIRVRWAVRISDNGEFIHANPASAEAQGNANVTNGCINLSTEDAEGYFHTAIYGDPVEVTGSPIGLSEADGNIWDWAIDWETWRSLSALPRAEAVTSTAGPAGPVSGRPGG